MKLPLLRAAVVASTLAAILVPASPASAQSTEVPDLVADTWKRTFDSETHEELPPEPAGSHLNTDLLSTSIDHTGRRIVVKATYQELKRADYRFGFTARVRTNEGLKRAIAVESFSRPGWAGSASVTAGMWREVPCPGIRHEIDFAANTVFVSVPRVCLSNPRWIQASVGAFSLPEAEGGTAFIAFVDNGHNPSMRDTYSWTERLHRG